MQLHNFFRQFTKSQSLTNNFFKLLNVMGILFEYILYDIIGT